MTQQRPYKTEIILEIFIKYFKLDRNVNILSEKKIELIDVDNNIIKDLHSKFYYSKKTICLNLSDILLEKEFENNNSEKSISCIRKKYILEFKLYNLFVLLFSIIFIVSVMLIVLYFYFFFPNLSVNTLKNTTIWKLEYISSDVNLKNLTN